ncbi:DUF2835 domain-containing protein [Catenovulum sp. 2E275]|uniref:DUF2835 domain-containing protein n=1 Tax=Catenovulum sp. 2E275 TaxID=2980497 RepID=UPI0021D00708|nr:DUF2835 domain-containing protein [Catenovulum sp. 2E275]MCU4674683.1 DUF2835 domain-containing protein [Catenovulum sp. 2E275]
MTFPYNIYFFSLNISYLECQVFYTGQLQHALLISEDGCRVQIPIINLRKHLDSRGLKGRFRLLTNTQNKIISFERLSY